ncbi:MAG TPA: hypothetical protein VFI61_02945 [Patescibacteria group bacterium]|nr:hypothetical protein [Patescibacteria group bacterium]
MKTRDIVVGFLVLVVLISGIVLLKKSRDKNALTPVATPSVQTKLRDTFTGIVIPENDQKAELKDISGGDSFGIVTSTEVLANLPELKSNEFYQIWLTKDNNLIRLGKMKEAKGGWILEYNFSNLSGYKIVVAKGDKQILEGSF